MDFLAILKIAIRALTRNKMRSLLTMLGIVIGVGAVIATVGLGQGAQQQVQDQIASLGTNLLYISSGSVNKGGIRTGGGATKTLTSDDMKAIVQEVPTIAQAGFPALTFDGLIGLFGPRDMAAAARDRIAADIREVAADPVVASRLAATGQIASPGTATEFAASIEGQRDKLAVIAKELGIKSAQ